MSDELRDAMRRASEARRGGRLAEARAIVDPLLAEHPTAAALLNLAGLIAGDEGRGADSMALFRRAVDADPAAPPLWLNLAAACRSVGEVSQEIAALDRALACDPELLPALLLKAEALERAGRTSESARAYRAVLTAARDEAALPAATQAALERGRAVVARDDAARAAEHGDMLAGVFAAHEGADFTRARAYVDAMLGKRRLYRPEPTGPLFPGLEVHEYFDPALFPWFAALEAAFTDIRDELIGIWEEGERRFDPYINVKPGRPLNQWAELDRSPRWGAYFLWKDGLRREAECAACPKTAAILDALPMLDIPGLAPTAMFSILDSGTRIPAHTGVTNTRVTVHLPLVVPPGCGFRVGGETREWREGEAWAFDDTIEHEAWNEGERPRAILIIDAWNPLLSEAERDVVRTAAGAMRL